MACPIVPKSLFSETKRWTQLRLNASDVYKLPAEPVDSNMARSDHIRMITNINYHSLPSPRQQHVRLGFPLVGRDHGLATATVIGRSTDFAGCDAIINIFCYSKHLATLRFDKVYTSAHDKTCRMTMRGREFTRNYGGRKGSQRKHFQLARHRREKSLKVPLDIRLIRRWFDIIARCQCQMTDRS